MIKSKWIIRANAIGKCFQYWSLFDVEKACVVFTADTIQEICYKINELEAK